MKKKGQKYGRFRGKIRKKNVHQEGENESVSDILYNVVKNVALQLNCLHGDMLG